MGSTQTHAVDPLTTFYAAVTAVENGSVGEIELNFRREFKGFQCSTTITVRKDCLSFDISDLTDPE